MIRSITRLPKYYLLRIRRLRGDPTYLAKGFGFGVFMGVLPLVPVQTILIIPLSITFRVSTIAAVIAATLVSNPLTFVPQYYITWKLGNAILPGRISWEQLQGVLHTIENEGVLDGIVTFSHLGIQTIAVLLTGGMIIGIPAGVISYFIALKAFRGIRRRRAKRHELNKIRKSREKFGKIKKIIQLKKSNKSEKTDKADGLSED